MIADLAEDARPPLHRHHREAQRLVQTRASIEKDEATQFAPGRCSCDHGQARHRRCAQDPQKRASRSRRPPATESQASGFSHAVKNSAAIITFFVRAYQFCRED